MTNVGSLLTTAAVHHGEHVALRFGSQRWSFAELDARVDALAAGLRELGVQPGDRVACLSWNRPEVIETMFAVFKLGLVLVPLNPRYTAGEVAYHLQDSQAAVLVHGPGFATVVIEAVRQSTSVRHVLAVGGETADPSAGDPADPGRMLDYEREIARHAGAVQEAADVADDDCCWLFYTSGTTGRPKGAMLTHSNLLFAVVGWVADLTPLTPDSVVLHVAPLSHGAGFHALVAVAKAATQVIPAPETVTAAETLELLVEHRVTDTWMVPTQITRMVAEIDARRVSGQPPDLNCLRSIVYGGAPFHVEDLRAAISSLGPVLVQLYGQGETPMTATFLTHAEHRLTGPESSRLGSAGHARTGMQVRVVDAAGRQVPDGVRGEIVVRGPAVMKGYWGRPEETADTLRGGWLHTGDVGTFQRGYLYVLDRLKDLIISGGSNVYAREVEEVLLEHPVVHEVAVVGIPDRDWGERVVAVVVPVGGSTVSVGALQEHVRSRLASYKRPKDYVSVDSLPRSGYGKVLKQDLRERLTADRPIDVHSPEES